ncbi:hypothetical protein FQN54_006197 [Arachnomyces sp. PD_36]|nr:hypothetical protein FQN54_006197 [Arachnomyces sp. PD_36]
MAFAIIALAILSLGLRVEGATAQEPLQQKIWSTVIWTLHGESTPYVYHEDRTLTPLGASQLFGAGAAFRNRYVNPPPMGSSSSYMVDGISRRKPLPTQISATSLPDQYVSASAQAFMQGLYPPLGSLANLSFPDESALMADGKILDFPLNGYQYPQIYTPNTKDPTYIWISGHTNCPAYTSSVEEYLSSGDYHQVESETSTFYNYLYTYALDGFFSSFSSVYSNALSIFEYLNYIYTHSPGRGPALSDVDQARSFADLLAFNLNGDLTAEGLNNDPIRAISGRTLARSVMSGLERNILTEGKMSKMTLLFGSFEPMIAFYSLVQLASISQPDFYRIPEFGSSLIFELFSLESDLSAPYPPSQSDLMVRFLFRNGTDPTNPPIPYPLFGHGPSTITIPYSEFEAEMSSIMISSSKAWCATCNSTNVFCPFYETPDCPTPNKGLKPAAAGAIGAGVTFIFCCIFPFSVLGLCYYRPGAHRGGPGLLSRGTKSPNDIELPERSPDGPADGDNDMSTGTTTSPGSPAGSINNTESHVDGFEMMPQNEHPHYPSGTIGLAIDREEDDRYDMENENLQYPRPVLTREYV